MLFTLKVGDELGKPQSREFDFMESHDQIHCIAWEG